MLISFFTMYSSRRARRIKSEFSPSLRKANYPNYYQRKGRTIQQTPLLIQDLPTELLSRKKLDKLYRTLVRYKYPIPVPPLSYPIQFTETITFYFDIFKEANEYTYHQSDFKQAMDQYMLTDHSTLSNYTFSYQLFSIRFFTPNSAVDFDTDVLGTLTWQSSLNNYQPVNILTKQYQVALSSNSRSNFVRLRPQRINSSTQTVEAWYYQIRVTQGGSLSSVTSTLITLDGDIGDNGDYPLMDTSQDDYGILDLTYDNTENQFSALRMSWEVLITATSNS